jgi:hypothetical protein
MRPVSRSITEETAGRLYLAGSGVSTAVFGKTEVNCADDITSVRMRNTA